MKKILLVATAIMAMALFTGCTNGDAAQDANSTKDSNISYATTNTDDDTTSTTTTNESTASTTDNHDNNSVTIITTNYYGGQETQSTTLGYHNIIEDDTTYQVNFEGNATLLIGDAGGVSLILLYDVNMSEIAKSSHIDIEVPPGFYTFIVFTDSGGAFYYAAH